RKVGYAGIRSEVTEIFSFDKNIETVMESRTYKSSENEEGWCVSVKTRRVGTILYKIYTKYGDGRSFETPWEEHFGILSYQGAGFWSDNIGCYLSRVDSTQTGRGQYTEGSPIAPGRRLGVLNVGIGGVFSYVEYTIYYQGTSGPAVIPINGTEDSSTSVSIPDNTRVRDRIAAALGMTGGGSYYYHTRAGFSWTSLPRNNGYQEWGRSCVSSEIGLINYSGSRSSFNTSNYDSQGQKDVAYVSSFNGAYTFQSILERTQSFDIINQETNEGPEVQWGYGASCVVTDEFPVEVRQLIPVGGAFDVIYPVETSSSSRSYYDYQYLPDGQWITPTEFYPGFSTRTVTIVGTLGISSATGRTSVFTFGNNAQYCYFNAYESGTTRRILRTPVGEIELQQSDPTYSLWQSISTGENAYTSNNKVIFSKVSIADNSYGVNLINENTEWNVETYEQQGSVFNQNSDTSGIALAIPLNANANVNLLNYYQVNA
ncbi:MAG: hypothetical protein ACRC62_08730, partial [Microcoleus sp.]